MGSITGDLGDGALEKRVRQRTDELELEREKLETIVDQMPGGVAVAEAPSGRILTVNKQARAILGAAGTDAKDVLGRYLREDTSLDGALQGQAVSHERIERTKPDGSLVVLSVTASPIRDSSGRITAAVSIFEDVTVREAREQADPVDRDGVIEPLDQASCLDREHRSMLEAGQQRQKLRG